MDQHSASHDTRARLHEAEEKFRTLVEHGTAIVYIDEADPPSDTIYISPQVVDIFGWTPEELIADQDLWWSSIHPDDMARVDEIEREDAPAFSLEYRVINRRGETVWLHEQGTMMNDVDGKPLYWIGLAIDVTEAKRAALLERELALEQEASAKLKALDQAKDDLLAAVSHDFRSPLSSIIGFSLTLKRSLPTLAREDVEDFVERIVQNAWKLERLVSDVLDVSRLRAGQLELKPVEADVGELVREIVSRITVDPGSTLHVETESVTVPVDAAMLERVVDNLVLNAVRHNPDGARIRIEVRAADGGASIVVADDGVGIPKNLERTLFEPFTSGPEVRDDPSPGLGLGLSIVQQVVTLHGGRVDYEATEGGGATFRVFLPSAR